MPSPSRGSRTGRATRRAPAASSAQQSSLLDAVVAAARFERSVRRARYPRVERGLGRAALELRRLTSRSPAMDGRPDR
jgi:hypothetical protein